MSDLFMYPAFRCRNLQVQKACKFGSLSKWRGLPSHLVEGMSLDHKEEDIRTWCTMKGLVEKAKCGWHFQKIQLIEKERETGSKLSESTIDISFFFLVLFFF